MLLSQNADYLAGLVSELRRLADEEEWVEFKVNNSDPQGSLVRTFRHCPMELR